MTTIISQLPEGVLKNVNMQKNSKRVMIVVVYEGNKGNRKLADLASDPLWVRRSFVKMCRHHERNVAVSETIFFFQLPEDFTVKFNEAEGELTVGGVYLRLFVQQPAWVR